jgi:hypothetical protein
MSYSKAIQVVKKTIFQRRLERSSSTLKIHVKYIPAIAMLTLGLLAPAMTTQKASALSYYTNECTPQYFSQWDAPALIKAATTAQSGGEYYVHGTTPIFMFRSTSYDADMLNGTPARNIFTLLVAKNNTNRWQLGFERPALKAKLFTTGGYYVYSVFDEPKGSAYNYDQFHNSQARPFLTFTAETTVASTYAPDMTNSSCWVTMMGNSDIAQTWKNEDFADPPSNLEYSTSDSSSSGCGVLEVGCWIGYYFKPNSTTTQASFTRLNDSMQLKLGFLTYPITFIADMFGAFTSSSAWCTSTSCTKSFGDFMGANFTLNLNQMAATMPTLWNFLMGALRGLTVLALIFGIRKKYMEVIHR